MGEELMFANHWEMSPFQRPSRHLPVLMLETLTLSHPEMLEVEVYPAGWGCVGELMVELRVHPDDLAVIEDSLDALFKRFRGRAFELLQHMVHPSMSSFDHPGPMMGRRMGPMGFADMSVAFCVDIIT